MRRTFLKILFGSDRCHRVLGKTNEECQFLVQQIIIKFPAVLLQNNNGKWNSGRFRWMGGCRDSDISYWFCQNAKKLRFQNVINSEKDGVRGSIFIK